jgi:hypothetical protein
MVKSLKWLPLLKDPSIWFCILLFAFYEVSSKDVLYFEYCLTLFVYEGIFIWVIISLFDIFLNRKHQGVFPGWGCQVHKTHHSLFLVVYIGHRICLESYSYPIAIELFYNREIIMQKPYLQSQRVFLKNIGRHTISSYLLP